MNWLFLSCIVAISIGTRLVLGSVIPGMHEYEAIFLYGSDILVIFFISWSLWQGRKIIRRLFHENGGVLIFVLFIAALTSLWSAPSFWLGLYGFIRLFILIGFAYTVGVVAWPAKAFRAALITIAVIALIQSIIGIAQFSLQESVGLQIFGEPSLVSYAGSASTINIEGGRVLRAYGTFPHPNVYAGFLALGLLTLSYFYLWCESQLKKDIFNHPRNWWNWRHGIAALNLYIRHRYFYLRLLLAAAAFLTTVGLVLSFSRSGWIAAIIGSITLCVGALRARFGVGAVIRLALMLGSCVTICYLMFAPLIIPRSQFERTDPAVNERLIYGQIGVDVLSDSVGGVGVGNQVLYGVQNELYQKYGLTKIWNWEPIHNLFILIGAELGWLGLLSFLVFLGMIVFGEKSRTLWKTASLEWVIVMAMLFALMATGLFDHYLWTIQAGKIMLWLVIGLCLSRLPVAKKAG